ncbi:hypothetical protein [Patulibacter minatonensis]|uniref:hypothetical protein n=1 Tax=Patulibacter minatonensis TaxID=298163 RepID=UPI000479107C|nr:hypothetical protein [Patulibacter minatonensis]
MPDARHPWAPDLATPAGRRELAERIARAPAIVVPARELGPGAPERLAPRRPRLVVGITAGSGAVLVTLDHVVRPDAAHPLVLRRRLAVVSAREPDDDVVDEAVMAWSVLARQHADLEDHRRGGLRRARRLARRLRP